MYPSASLVCAVMTCVVCLSQPMRTLASPLDGTGSDVDPVISLNQMQPDHACLFICNICFPELSDTSSLMDCSNKVCGPVTEGRCAMEKFIWLGHHCKDYPMVEAMWSAHAVH